MEVPATMRGAVGEAYGPPEECVRVVDLPVPALSRPDDVLVKVAASSVNKGDWHLASGIPGAVRLAFGFSRPPTSPLGSDLSGVVVAVGQGVKELRVGDEVFGMIPTALGGFAEYAVVKEAALAPKPPETTHEAAAAAASAGITALQAIREHGKPLTPDSRVCVIGASGGCGSLAVQLCKAQAGGEVHVTAVCSGASADHARAQGADDVVDYTAGGGLGTGGYDLVLDFVGTRPVQECLEACKEKGTYVAVSGPMDNYWLGPFPRGFYLLFMSMLSTRKISWFFQEPNEAGIVQQLRQHLADGVLAPPLGERFSLDDVPRAIALQGRGHVRGKNVVIIAAEDK